MQHCCSDGISLWGRSPICICCCMVGSIRSNVTATVAYRFPMHRRACQGIRCTATRADVFAVRLAQALPGAAPRYCARRQMRWLRACRIAASSKMWCIYCRPLCRASPCFLRIIILDVVGGGGRMTANGVSSSEPYRARAAGREKSKISRRYVGVGWLGMFKR